MNISNDNEFAEYFTSISTNLIPAVNATFSIGTSNQKWKDIYVSGNLVLSNIVGSPNVYIESNTINLTSPSITLPSIVSATQTNVLYYDTVTKGVSYGIGSLFPAITVQAASGTLTLTAGMNRSTYILTGISATQTIATSLSGVASGYCVFFRNGNNTTGGTKDITLSGAVSPSVILHTKTASTNSSYILLFWNGTALVAYT